MERRVSQQSTLEVIPATSAMAAFLKRDTKPQMVIWSVLGALTAAVLAVIVHGLVTGTGQGLAVGVTILWLVICGPMTYVLVNSKRVAKKDLAGGTCQRYTGPIEGNSEGTGLGTGSISSTDYWLHINQPPDRLTMNRNVVDYFREAKHGQVLFTPHGTILEVRGPSDEVVYRNPAYSGEVD